MKLATYKDGSRDGLLVVVSRDLASAHYAVGIATRLQQALDDWNFIAPQLEALSQTLDHGKARHAFPFDPAQCMAPLPRAGLWATPDNTAMPPADADPARVPAPPSAWRWGAGDDFAGACDPFRRLPGATGGLDFGAGLAVVTGDVSAGCDPSAALDAIRLLMLVDDRAWHEDGTPPDGAVGRPAPAFGPVAVTSDELGAAWRQGRAALKLHAAWNGKPFGLCDAAAGQRLHFGELIAALSRGRRLRAGAIVGAGVAAAGDPSLGHLSIAGRRALETAEHGTPKTSWLRHGDRVRLEAKGADGQSVFGAIEAVVHDPAPAAADPVGEPEGLAAT